MNTFETSHDTPSGTLFVFPRETSPEELLEFVTEMQSEGIPAEGYHPWWGDATRVQHLMELSTGVAIGGCPFVISSTVRKAG